jgi:PHD/YefM family antitoxin component YafN of YafNO toxin-antitoxin module
MKTVTVTDLQHDVTHYLELAEEEDILILKNGKPVGFLRGFADEDDLFDYQLESDPRFLERVKRARAQCRAGRGIRLEVVKTELLDAADDA